MKNNKHAGITRFKKSGQDKNLTTDMQRDITMEINSMQEFVYHDPETKTWCSYMEKGFRESRVLTNEQPASEKKGCSKPG